MSRPKDEPKFIEFVLQARPAGRVTDVWIVWPKGERDPMKAIGLVEWFTRWRCYSFFPVAETIFERRCLRDIADFLEAETKKRKLEREG